MKATDVWGQELSCGHRALQEDAAASPWAAPWERSQAWVWFCGFVENGEQPEESWHIPSTIPVDVSIIPLTNAVGKLFLESQRIFYKKFSWGRQEPLVKQKIGLIPKQEEMSTAQPSPQLLWSKMLSQARGPFPRDWSKEQRRGSMRSGRWHKGFPCSGQRHPCTAPWHPWHGTNQTCNLEAIPCLGVGLLLNFPSSPVSLHFLSGSCRSSFDGLSTSATPAAPSPPEALILHR